MSPLYKAGLALLPGVTAAFLVRKMLVSDPEPEPALVSVSGDGGSCSRSGGGASEALGDPRKSGLSRGVPNKPRGPPKLARHALAAASRSLGPEASEVVPL